MTSSTSDITLAALSLEAIFANNCVISQAIGGVKLIFLEQSGPHAVSRMVVFLPMAFAEELAKHFPEAIEKIRQAQVLEEPIGSRMQ